jgi:hypothetical protein
VKFFCAFFAALFFLTVHIEAESFRTVIAGSAVVSPDRPSGFTVPLSYNSSALISLGEEVRFLKGVQMELAAPQIWLSYRGSLALALYSALEKIPQNGTADLQGRRFFFEPIPNKLQTVYQTPLRGGHGLRTTPYLTVTQEIIDPSSFPLLFRIMPVIKGLSEELENMRFQLTVKPVISDEGAVKLHFKYPELLPGRPFIVLIDDAVVENTSEERLLKEGEHQLVILSDDYRSENRRFKVERAKILEVNLELQDPTPLLLFEAPENARIYLDNNEIYNTAGTHPVEPGAHEVKFRISDYVIVKNITVQRGKTYRVSMLVDVQVSENE